MTPVLTPILPTLIEPLSPASYFLRSPLLPAFPSFPAFPPLPALPSSQPSLPNLFPQQPTPTSTTRPVNGAYATFISKDDYLPGALVLAYCHQAVKSKYPFIILATPSLSHRARAIIKKARITLIDIDSLVPAREQYDPSVTDERFRETWTKLRCVHPSLLPVLLLIYSPHFLGFLSKHNTRSV